jgi:hypothetical protein
MNSALSHNISSAISRVAPAFKISGDEVSTRLLAVLFPVPTVTLPTAPVVAAAPPPPTTPPKPKAAPAPVAPPAPAKPKVPVLNLVGLNPTLQKKLVALYDEANGGGHDDAYADAAESFLAHVNRMPAKEFAAKPALDHLREFLKPQRSNAAAAPAVAAPPKVVAPPPKPAEVEVDENCVAVLYKGREYWVGEESKRVYLETSEGVHELRGMLGLAEFDAMVMPEDEV